MQTSEQVDKIIPAYVKAEAAVGPAVKGTTNGQFGSKYADLESVVDACREALKENDLAVWQSVDETGERMITRICHTSGQWIEGYVPLIVAKKDMQGLGSAITYARRYGLMAALNVAPEDDDGNAAAAASANAADEEKKRQQQQKSQPKQAQQSDLKSRAAALAEELSACSDTAQIKDIWNRQSSIDTMNELYNARHQSGEKMKQHYETCLAKANPFNESEAA